MKIKLLKSMAIFSLLAICLVEGAEIFRLKKDTITVDDKPSYSDEDSKFVAMSISEWAKKNGTLEEKSMKGRYVKVMHIASDVCVSLEIDPGGVGGVPVYCYNASSSLMTKKVDDVE